MNMSVLELHVCILFYSSVTALQFWNMYHGVYITVVYIKVPGNDGSYKKFFSVLEPTPYGKISPVDTVCSF